MDNRDNDDRIQDGVFDLAVSSEAAKIKEYQSPVAGDVDIMERTIGYADFIIPASYYSRLAAEKYISSGKIILPPVEPEKFRDGTLGATAEQVIEGLKKGLRCDADALVCIGEAAVKYKENIKIFVNSEDINRFKR